MRTMQPSSFLSSVRSPSGVFSVVLALLLLAGCDASGDLDEDTENTVSPEETAESIAFSLAQSTGGTADEFADAAALAQGHGTSKALSRECEYNDGDQQWKCEIEITGSRGRASVDVGRTYRARFFAGGAAVRAPAEADSMTFEIVEGTGRVETPRIDNSHELVPSTWSLSGLQDDTYTVALRSDQAGRDVSEQFTGPRRQRTRDAQLRKTQTSDLVWRRDEGLVGGTIEGTYEATVVIERADGSTVTRSVDASFEATFSPDGAALTFTGGGERFTGESFEFDLTTGALE